MSILASCLHVWTHAVSWSHHVPPCCREACERDLISCLKEMAESSTSDLQAYATDCLAGCAVSGDECRMLRAELRLQVTGVSHVSPNTITHVSPNTIINACNPLVALTCLRRCIQIYGLTCIGMGSQTTKRSVKWSEARWKPSRRILSCRSQSLGTRPLD